MPSRSESTAASVCPRNDVLRVRSPESRFGRRSRPGGNSVLGAQGSNDLIPHHATCRNGVIGSDCRTRTTDSGLPVREHGGWRRGWSLRRRRRQLIRSPRSRKVSTSSTLRRCAELESPRLAIGRASTTSGRHSTAVTSCAANRWTMQSTDTRLGSRPNTDPSSVAICSVV